MRRIILAMVFASTALLGASSQASPGSCRSGFDDLLRPIIVCDDSGGEPTAEPVDTRPEIPPVPDWNFVLGPEGVSCIARTGWMDLTGLSPERIEYLRAFADNTYNAMLTLGFEPCPGVDAPVTPYTWALDYIRSIDLPVPVPEIEPGEMLVGLEAFLETGSPRTHVLDDVSPFGPVHVELTSEVRVNWGDSSVTEWSTAPDGPYPDGELTHYWTRKGTYDVTVTLRWVAAWSVGDQSGVIRDGLSTEGTLAAFPVREIEAVIVG